MRYVVGDLGYALNRDDWDDYCFSETLPEGAFSFRTGTGDGTYFDQDGFAYGVDSGTIGILPLDKVSDKEKLREALKYRIVQVVDLPEVDETDCYEEDGIITLGSIVINTLT